MILLLLCSCILQSLVLSQLTEEIRKQIGRGYKGTHVRYPNTVHSADNTEHYELTRTKPVNILMILADDLGYGDLSVSPFTGSGIHTPYLEKMAQRGVVLTNFHSAATVCSPSRAAILTGMYPWRLGMKSVFEYGTKKSNRDDWLIQTPNAATLFAANNYTTFHSGKWHLGGMRNDDYDMRRLKEKGEGVPGSRRCHHPGPQQQGFQHYVSVLDGPGAPRQNYLQVNDRLYSEGCNYLLYDDIPINKEMFNITGYLSYCEARHAMRGMKESLDQGKPFYIHLWFHAPHGPWEHIPGYPSIFTNTAYPKDRKNAVPCDVMEVGGRSRYCMLKNGRIVDRGSARFGKYATMVADMDKQIGMVLDYITELGIERDTFVFFTSDNGYEDEAGGAGGLRANKRHIYEGGIRVPAIAQWIGTFPAGGVVNTMSVNTDLFPTFADAAGLSIPREKYFLDGVSILPELIHAINPTNPIERKNENDKDNSISSSKLAYIPSKQTFAPYGIHQIMDFNIKLSHINIVHKPKKNLRKRASMFQERLILYLNEYEGPRRTIGIAYDYKFILDEQENPMEIYDLHNDLKESDNLLISPRHLSFRPAPNSPHANIHNNNNNNNQQKHLWDDFKRHVLNQSHSSIYLHGFHESPVMEPFKEKKEVNIRHLRDLPAKLSKSMFKSYQTPNYRKDPFFVFHLLYRLYPLLYYYAHEGANGYKRYVEQHPEIRYDPSPLSDQRPMASNVMQLYTPQRAEQIRKNLVEQGSCPVKSQPYPCRCDVSTLSTAPPLPIHKEDYLLQNIYYLPVNPIPFVNASYFIFDL